MRFWVVRKCPGNSNQAKLAYANFNKNPGEPGHYTLKIDATGQQNQGWLKIPYGLCKAMAANARFHTIRKRNKPYQNTEFFMSGSEAYTFL
jgi:hypothetical protein